MKKIIASLISLASLGAVNAADYAGCPMMGYPTMMGGGVALYGLFYFLIFAFLFAAIFWVTYKWLVEGKKRR